MSLDLDPALYTAIGVFVTTAGVIAKTKIQAWRAARRAARDETIATITSQTDLETAKIEATAAVTRTELVRAERVDLAHFAHDAAVAPVLAKALEGYQAEVVEIRRERTEDRKRLDECEKKHRQAEAANGECEKKYAQLTQRLDKAETRHASELAERDAELARVAARAAEGLAQDDTGVHELREIQRTALDRASKSAPELKAFPAPARRPTILPPRDPEDR